METGQRFSTFCIRIERIAKNIQRYKTLRMAELDLRSTHVMCLFQLYRHPEGMTVTGLAEACQVDKAQISRVTRELAARGYLLGRERGGAYRRPLLLSASGTEAAGKLLEMVDRAVVEAGGDASPAELDVFYRVLSSIDRNLCGMIDQTEEKQKA